MKMYEFNITIFSGGKNVDEAWQEAVIALACDPGETPEDFEVIEDNG